MSTIAEDTGDGDGDGEGDGDGDGDDSDPCGNGFVPVVCDLGEDGEGGEGSGEGDGDGDGCDLFQQDCEEEGTSCYPTVEGGECLPTGTAGSSEEMLEPCMENNDCIEGFFCNPENFMHCVPFCVVGEDCENGYPCNDPGPDAEFVGLPDGVGYCYPWP